jgi:general secretion pathway protein A
MSMYQEFYGLRELPFELTANTRFLFLSHRQREALSILQYGLLSAKALTLLVGDAGTGKTTLIRAAVESERCSDIRCIYLNNPVLSREDFVTLLARRFELGPDAATSKSILLEQLEQRLLERRDAGETTALIVDEAQSLSMELLEEVRLLANMETPDDKLLPVVLAGQPELADRLEYPEMRQLKQRVALRCELEPFDLDDTAAYIASRIHAAGGSPAGMFTQEAVRLIHDRARGIPRIVNVICDNALVSGMAMGHRRVERAAVVEVCADLRLLGSSDAELPSAEAPVAPAAIESVPAVGAVEHWAGQVEEPVEVEPSRKSRFNFRFRWKGAQSYQAPAKVTE